MAPAILCGWVKGVACALASLRLLLLLTSKDGDELFTKESGQCRVHEEVNDVIHVFDGKC